MSIGKKRKTIDSFFKLTTDKVTAVEDSFATIGVSPEDAAHGEPSVNVFVEPIDETNWQNQIHGRAKPIFNDINSLERDPGLRPQILDCPVNQRDVIRMAYLKLSHMQPLLKNYKASGKQGHQRRFQYKWLSRFTWLEYSASTDRAYCFPCFIFNGNLKKRAGSDVFTAKGFDNWKKVNNGDKCAFLPHEGTDTCSIHNNAIRACEDLLNQPGHIETMLATHMDEEIKNNRLRLKVSVASVRYLAFQALAFRGHDETTQSKNRDSSAKRHDELHDFQESDIGYKLAIGELETGRGSNQIGALQRPGEIRWGSHLRSICSLLGMFNTIISVLRKIADDGSNYSIRPDADTALDYSLSFEFVFIMWLMGEVLEIVDLLCQALQKKNQDIVNAINLVSSSKTPLQNLRNDGWEKFLSKVVSFCETHGIDVPNMNDIYIMRGGRARQQFDQITNEKYFRVDLFIVVIDTQLQELNEKFNEKVMELLSLMVTLVPRNSFRSFDDDEICGLVKKYYPEDFTEQDRRGLRLQLNHFKIDISENSELKKIGTLVDLCQSPVKYKKYKIYLMVDRLIRLLVILPVSIASAERAFSTLKIINTTLRNKMEDEFLANSLVVHVEGDIVANTRYEDIIENFKNLKPRRVAL